MFFSPRYLRQFPKRLALHFLLFRQAQVPLHCFLNPVLHSNLGRISQSTLSLGDVEISVDGHVFHFRECESWLLSAEGNAIIDALSDKDNDLHETGWDYPDSFLHSLE
jgi:hypothetical protein